MSDPDGKTTEQGSNSPSSSAAFSADMETLSDALGILYIRNNASGRNKFREKWPKVARYLFGDILIASDNDGMDDWDRRAELEKDAEERRLLVKNAMVEIVEKSVDAGQLQFDYVGGIIDQFGAEMSSFLYARDVIERVRPGILAEAEKKAEDVSIDNETDIEGVSSDASQELKEAVPLSETKRNEDDVVSSDVDITSSQGGLAPISDDAALSEEEKTILSNVVAADDIEDSVRPIDSAESIGRSDLAAPAIFKSEDSDTVEEGDDVQSQDTRSESVPHPQYSALFNQSAKP